MKGQHYNIEHQSVPAFFMRGPSSIARLVFFSALSLTLIATDSHLKYLASIRQTLEEYLHPLELIVNAPAEFYHQSDSYFTTHHHLLAENKQLKEQALKKNIALQQLNLLALENDHLRGLVNAKNALAEQSVLGEVLYVSRDRFTKKIVVNRGAIHKVVLGSAVVDGTGIIGQVTRLFPRTSEVTLISDKSLEIPVVVERNGLRAIAFGQGQDNVIEIPYLPTNVDIKPGDRLMTSGIDGVYPAGIAVAMVKKIDNATGTPFARIICVPTGGVESSRQVLLVNLPRVALPEGEATPNSLAPVSANATSTNAMSVNESIQKTDTQKTAANQKQAAMPNAQPMMVQPHATE